MRTSRRWLVTVDQLYLWNDIKLSRDPTNLQNNLCEKRSNKLALVVLEPDIIERSYLGSRDLELQGRAWGLHSFDSFDFSKWSYTYKTAQKLSLDSQPLFKLALMTVYDIFKYQLAMFMYCVNSLLPQELKIGNDYVKIVSKNCVTLNSRLTPTLQRFNT